MRSDWFIQELRYLKCQVHFKMGKYFKQGCVVYCIILYYVDGNHTCTCIITYDESGVWDAVGASGGRGGEWSQHFHQSLMIFC